MVKKPSKKQSTPYAPPTSWDRGADGPANRQRLRVEPATEINPETGRETPNPNSVYRYRRQSWVQVYARKGHLTPDQRAAAEKLRMASEGIRERDPLAAIGEVRIMSTGGAQEAMIDARRYFRDLWAAVPISSRPVIERVVLHDEPIWSGCGGRTRERHMQRLRNGLDAIS